MGFRSKTAPLIQDSESSPKPAKTRRGRSQPVYPEHEKIVDNEITRNDQSAKIETPQNRKQRGRPRKKPAVSHKKQDESKNSRMTIHITEFPNLNETPPPYLSPQAGPLYKAAKNVNRNEQYPPTLSPHYSVPSAIQSSLSHHQSQETISEQEIQLVDLEMAKSPKPSTSARNAFGFVLSNAGFAVLSQSNFLIRPPQGPTNLTIAQNKFHASAFSRVERSWNPNLSPAPMLLPPSTPPRRTPSVPLPPSTPFVQLPPSTPPGRTPSVPLPPSTPPKRPPSAPLPSSTPPRRPPSMPLPPSTPPKRPPSVPLPPSTPPRRPPSVPLPPSTPPGHPPSSPLPLQQRRPPNIVPPDCPDATWYDYPEEVISEIQATYWPVFRCIRDIGFVLNQRPEFSTGLWDAPLREVLGVVGNEHNNLWLPTRTGQEQNRPVNATRSLAGQAGINLNSNVHGSIDYTGNE